MREIRLSIVGVLAVVGLVMATGSFAQAQMIGDMAQVRVVHASPDAPAVDIWVDGQPAIRGLSFGQATGHTPLPAGERRVQVTPSGGQPSSAVIDATLPLTAGQSHTVMATGRLAEIKPLVLTDERIADAGGSEVRVVHASPGAPAVDIAVAGGPTLFSALPFGEASAYADVPTGNANIEVRAAGSNNVVLRIPDASFAPGFVYTIAAVGLANGQPPLQALALSDRR